ncbi:abortive infection system antitoxin AbiGi family protein [Vibrio harveyi]|uniref:abortive infection system antitoxin AbiGi family protein n=1 Tax=Vibrio harveyi TaxID=669 RepID=UPI00066BBBA7|nr:abortive infection system antitoxin AbiGi family protein [Vibrio harveyi]
MRPKSDNLFHFTNSLDVLKLILKNGIYPRYCLEDIEWFGLANDKHIAFPMSCFCDIPLSRISEHTDFYGNFGLGLTKEWGEKNGLNPVIYSPDGGVAQGVMKYLFYKASPTNENDQSVYNHGYKLWSLIKPLKGRMVIAGNLVEKDFYQESEWRYVPPVRDLITASTFEEDKEHENEKLIDYKLQISPNDIRYIFVQSDSDIPSLVDFINSEMAAFPLNDLKILQSRIVSLEMLALDL